MLFLCGAVHSLGFSNREVLSVSTVDWMSFLAVNFFIVCTCLQNVSSFFVEKLCLFYEDIYFLCFICKGVCIFPMCEVVFCCLLLRSLQCRWLPRFNRVASEESCLKDTQKMHLPTKLHRHNKTFNRSGYDRILLYFFLLWNHNSSCIKLK